MKIAFIILAHKNPEQLARLIGKLNSKDSAFFLHIDKKVKISDFKIELSKLNTSANITMLPRINSYWGGVGIITATLHGLEKVLLEGKYNWIVLLSGQDYPIKSLNYIFDFFDINEEKNFVPYFKLPSDIWPDGLNRINNYYFRFFGKTYISPPVSEPIHVYSKLFYKIAKIRFRKPREFPEGLQPYGGFQFWKITSKAAKEIMDFIYRRPDYLKFHKYTNCADELFFQTILLNSKNELLQNSIINDDLTYINWIENKPNPEILGISDFEELKMSNDLFARKFDIRINSEILDMIDIQTLVEEGTLLLH
ncbi:MAG: beta-1,6-N-acetylglucosaminyltransferase [Ignavibacteriaceae bacterium]|nr:beta-1,6-N-acetylglucosaminyltransferase [Ignavibacteriaceae bacterium]